MLLKDKNILLGVSSSIAIYKSLELIRLYVKAGANVKVIMTEASQKFITPLTFEAISQNRVLCEDSESWDKFSDYNHIDIGKWADIFVIAPCTANTINKLASGIADNLLTQTALAFTKEKVLAPAANTNMILNPLTQESLNKLRGFDYKIVSSQVKELACKDVGDGAMAEPSDIFYASARELLKDEYWANRSVVLSGGGTVEKIDDVRYISNFSSGKMASALSLALYLKGANVTLVSTRGYENLPKDINVLCVFSSNEMHNCLEDSLILSKKESKNKPYFFMVAAVSDYIPNLQKNGKLKKNEIGSSWDLELKQNIDILKTLDKSEMVSIGFKAEMDEGVALENAKNMLEKKSLDAVCLNILEDKNSFGTQNNEIELVLKDNNSHRFSGDKLDISLELLQTLEREF
ncbi:MAG: bifunctional phosphopantothenoylcysteine decarboxylase/phosphopantothenate--cysteine ligase CoaBC [Campylobacterales bacterium]|nr:bifunctional phosphopantothenoylcysteine decarboxylase/phosphopantothenate--cysteine ligase CoaBC [Campylobacterales bacterium]